MDRPRALVTLADVAWPTDSGKRLRSEAVLRALLAHYDVEVVVVRDRGARTPVVPPDLERHPALRRVDVVGRPERGRVAAAVRLLGRGWPVRLGAYDWAPLAADVGARGSFALAWFGQVDHAVALRPVVRATRVVVDVDDVETAKWGAALAEGAAAGLSRLDRLQRRVELPLWRRLQREVLREADAAVVCSALDVQRLLADSRPRPRRGRALAQVAVVPNTYPDPGPPPPRAPADPPQLVLVASFATEENQDAAAVAAREVLPRVRAAVPGARLRLVGRHAETVAGLAALPGVELVGRVPDVGPPLAAAALALVPIRAGGGTRLKVLEALAHGVPVVATPVGAEGLDLVDGRDALLATHPEGLAVACVRLLADPALQQRLGAQGRARYEAAFRPTATQEAVSVLVAPWTAPPVWQPPAGG